jgi:hypothetical protein
MKKQSPQEIAENYFIHSLKRLLEIAEEEAPFLKDKTASVKEKNRLKHKFLESDSSDSKYSNEDR